jgi:hypothetical protein
MAVHPEGHESSPLMSREAAAAYLDVSVKTIDRMRADGSLRTVPIRGMIRVTEFDVHLVALHGTISGACDSASRDRPRPPGGVR